MASSSSSSSSNGCSEAAVALPDGWEEHVNRHGFRYYHHAESATTQWERPSAGTLAHAASARGSATPHNDQDSDCSEDELPTGWKRCWDEHGRPYFFNEGKQLSQWDRPEGERAESDEDIYEVLGEEQWPLLTAVSSLATAVARSSVWASGARTRARLPTQRCFTAQWRSARVFTHSNAEAGDRLGLGRVARGGDQRGCCVALGGGGGQQRAGFRARGRRRAARLPGKQAIRGDRGGQASGGHSAAIASDCDAHCAIWASR